MGFRREQEVFRLILKSYFDARRVDFPQIGPQLKMRPAHSNENWTHWTPHLDTVDTSLHRRPRLSRFQFRVVTRADRYKCAFLSILPHYWHTQCDTPGSRPLYKLHFVTVCPARNALMVFGLTSPSTLSSSTIHLLVPSAYCFPCSPRNLASAKNYLSLL